MDTQANRRSHTRLQSKIGEHDHWYIRFCKCIRRAHDSHYFRTIQYRNIPVDDHYIRVDVIDGVDRGKTISDFMYYSNSRIHQHGSGELAQVNATVRKENNAIFDRWGFTHRSTGLFNSS